MKTFISPIVKIIRIDPADIICTSGNPYLEQPEDAFTPPGQRVDWCPPGQGGTPPGQEKKGGW